MEGYILYFSKEERTVTEIKEKMKNYWKGLDIPETPYARLDEQRFINRFNYRKMQGSGLLDELCKDLQSAKESNKPEALINCIQMEIELTKAAMNDDYVGWLTCEGEYAVKDGTIYAKKNFINGFYDDIFNESSMLLTDKHGNKVVSGVCKDIVFDDFFKTKVAVYIEDSGQCIQDAEFIDDSESLPEDLRAVINFRRKYVKVTEDGLQTVHDKIPLDYYCHIVEVCMFELYTNL